MHVEQEVRDLCISHFSKYSVARSLCPQVRSTSAQLQFARRQLMRPQQCILRAMFVSWKHVVTFDKLYKFIRKQSHLNRKSRLETFLQESAPLVLSNRVHEWYKRVRTLCPKQHFRCIQMFDAHEAPMSQEQELDRLINYFQTLFTDVHDPLPHPPAIQDLPFTEADVLQELEQLPATKALAPDGFPALVWRHFASQLSPIVYECIRQAWSAPQCIPPTHWSTGWLHLFPKPNKIPNKPEALRPICLQHPVNKAMSGIHCRLLQKHTFPSLRRLPLFAYMAHRGTKDYLLIISHHSRTLCKDHSKDPSRQGLWGGIQSH